MRRSLMDSLAGVPMITRFVALGLIGLGARVLVSALVGDNHRVYYEYMIIARNLLDGLGYSFDEWGRAPLQPTSFLPPLGVWWCGAWMWLFPGNYLPMYVAQAVIQVSGIVPAYLIGKKLYSEAVGGWFAVLYTVYPEFVYMHSRPTTEFLYVPLALWTIVGYAALKDTSLATRAATRWSLLLGAIGATAVLVKEGAGILIAAILVSWWLHFQNKWDLVKRVYLPMAVVASVIMAPWIIRNVVVQGEFIAVRTGYGLTAWIANHPGATGTDKTLGGKYVLATLDSVYAAKMKASLPPDEQDRDRVYRQEAWRFIREYPKEYLSLTLKRLEYFVWFDATHPIARSRIYRAGYIALLLVAIPGIIVCARKRRLDRLFVIAPLGYMLLYVPVLVLPRYRIIPITILLFFAAVCVDWLVARIRGTHASTV